MDDNAQVSSVQQVSGQPVQGNQSASDQTVQTQSTQQQIARNVEPPGKQQPISISGHVEIGPVGSFQANEDPDDSDDDDEQPVAKQEVSNIKMSHPEVVMPQEVKDAGVTEGEDAKKEDLPEEKQEVKVEETVQSDVQNTVQQAGDDPTLPMSFGEAQLAAKKERSITNGLSWIIRMVIREWKKKLWKS